jgi:hypothetical protein
MAFFTSGSERMRVTSAELAIAGAGNDMLGIWATTPERQRFKCVTMHAVFKDRIDLSWTANTDVSHRLVRQCWDWDEFATSYVASILALNSNWGVMIF